MRRVAMILSCLLCPLAASAGDIHKFSLQGYSTTCGTAIASNGVVAGLSSGGGFGQSQPFLFTAGKFTLPAYGLPQGEVYYSGINRWGDLVGFVLTEEFSVLYFRVHAGVVTIEPVAALNGINDSGSLLQEVSQQSTQGFGFYEVGEVVRPNGAVMLVDDGTGTVQPNAMDATGERVVGTSYGPGGQIAWMYHAHRFVPVAVPGAFFTNPAGVDETGRVSGTYYSGSVDNPVAHGFLMRDRIYTTWDVPGATATQILGANESGQITGCFSNTTGQHGFIARP